MRHPSAGLGPNSLRQRAWKMPGGALRKLCGASRPTRQPAPLGSRTSAFVLGVARRRNLAGRVHFPGRRRSRDRRPPPAGCGVPCAAVGERAMTGASSRTSRLSRLSPKSLRPDCPRSASGSGRNQNRAKARFSSFSIGRAIHQKSCRQLGVCAALSSISSLHRYRLRSMDSARR